MATLGDYIFLSLVLAVIAAIAFAFRQGQAGSTLKEQQEALKKKGINISSSGLSVKSDRRALSQKELIDKTQQSFANSADLISKHKEAFHFGGSAGAGAGTAKKRS